MDEEITDSELIIPGQDVEPHTISFRDEDSESILTFHANGKISFVGDPDEAARIFFDSLEGMAQTIRDAAFKEAREIITTALNELNNLK